MTRTERRNPFERAQTTTAMVSDQTVVDLYYDYSTVPEEHREALRRSALTIKPRLKRAAEAGRHITLEGQEMDVATAGLARMNMILHDFPTANILTGNTLASPKFKDGERLRTYHYVVAKESH